MTGTDAQSAAATAGDGAMPEQDKGKAAAGKPAKGSEQQPPADEQLGEAGKAALDAEREARQRADKDLKELKAQLKQLQEKDLPEAERTAREHAELKASNQSLTVELQQLRGREAVLVAAGKLGFADASDAFRLIDIEYDEDGKPRGVEKALKDLLDSKPYLKSQAARAATGGSADAGNAGGTASGMDDMNSNIRRMAGRSAPPS